MRCGVSATTIRHNVDEFESTHAAPTHLSRLRLEPVEPGRLRGPDGIISLRIAGSAEARLLIVLIDPGSAASDVQWRFESCARDLPERRPMQIPPESV
jgi:hypothetical protein